MDYTLKKLPNFAPRKGPYLLVVMDGVGIGDKGKGDAVFGAQPPNLNKWFAETANLGLYTQLKAHGPAVGLPTEEDMGNSEVGHNALGSGQIYNQGAKLVDESLDTGRFFQTEKWETIIGAAAKENKTAHFIGLLSNGNVHSNISQLFKMLEGTAKSGIKTIRIHPLLDGRDVPPESGLEFIGQLEDKLKNLSETYKIDARIGSGGGRMHVTMDRYESDWNIVKRGYYAHCLGKVTEGDITPDYPGYFHSAEEAIKAAREVFPEKKDQYNPAFVIVDDDNNPIGRINEGDAVINFNFRGDRALEISKAFLFKEFSYFDRISHPNVRYAGLLEYDNEEHIPPVFLVPPPNIEYISTRYFCEMKVPSYALAETHKFGHVTYFWNGNRTGKICDKLETFEEIKSEPNEMIEGHPEMKADEVTEALMAAIDSDKYKYLRVNYANGDMVGHTGNYSSAVRAVKKVDSCLGVVIKNVMDHDGVVLVTADHGNCEEMLDKKGKVITSHSLNPVPCFILDANYQEEYVIDTTGITVPGISNVIPTFMNLMGYEAPSAYRKSIIRFK